MNQVLAIEHKKVEVSTLHAAIAMNSDSSFSTPIAVHQHEVSTLKDGDVKVLRFYFNFLFDILFEASSNSSL
jgi:hypothetical protein